MQNGKHYWRTIVNFVLFKIVRKQGNCFQCINKSIFSSYSHWWWKWIKYDNLKKKKPRASRSHSSTSAVKLNIHRKDPKMCVWWDSFGFVYYRLHKSNQSTTMDIIVGIEPYTQEKTLVMTKLTCCKAGQNFLGNTQLESPIPFIVVIRAYHLFLKSRRLLFLNLIHSTFS